VDSVGYVAALTTLRAARIPPAIVLQHLRHGLTEGRTCGECSGLIEFWGRERRWRYCWRTGGAAEVAGDTPACGEFHPREEGETVAIGRKVKGKKR
jgi:hypothetical protein